MKKEKKTPIDLSSTSAVLLANGYIRKAQQQLDTKIIIPSVIWQIIESFFYSPFSILDTNDKILIGDTNSLNSNSNAYLQHQYESYYYIKKYFFDSDSPYKIDGVVYSRIKFLDDSEIERINNEGSIKKAIDSYPRIGSERYGKLLNEKIYVKIQKKRHLEALNAPLLFAVCTAKPNNTKNIKGAFLLFYSSYYQYDRNKLAMQITYNISWKTILRTWSTNLKLNNLKKDWNDSKNNQKLESHLYVLSISEKEAEHIIDQNKEYYTCDQTNSKSIASRFPFFNIFNFFCRKGPDDIQDLRNPTYLNELLAKESKSRKSFFYPLSSKEFTPESLALKRYGNTKETIGNSNSIRYALPFIYLSEIQKCKEDKKNKENKENEENKENYESFQNQIKNQNIFVEFIWNKKKRVPAECFKGIETSYKKYRSTCK